MKGSSVASRMFVYSYYAFKNADATPPFEADACPNVYLGGMLVPVKGGGGRKW